MANNNKKAIMVFILKTISIFILLVVVALIYIYAKLDKMYLDENKDINMVIETDSPTITEEPEEEPTTNKNEISTPYITIVPKTNEELGIINIALFGMDNRYKYTIIGGRSDVNMLLTIDKNKEEVRLTSILRDTLVYVDALEDYNRLNAAIVYADGPSGAVECIENEFKIDIDYYMVTNFVGMARIINSLGGVNVYVSSRVIDDCNLSIMEMNPLMGYGSKDNLLSKSGTIHLNGLQAVAFMRQRKSEGGFARDDKQKDVLNALRIKLQNLSYEEIVKLLDVVSDNVKTDMKPLELVDITKQLYEYRNSDFTSLRIPLDDTYYMGWYNKMSVIQYEKEENVYKLYDYVYKGIYPYDEE